MLAVATVATAVVAEILVGSIETFAERAHLSDFFVAAVIVAIVGNAAEHGGAVLVAHRGKVELAAEIALSSSAQVAVFLIPAVALLSWLIDPLALSFRPGRARRRSASRRSSSGSSSRIAVEQLARRCPHRCLHRSRRSVLLRGRPGLDARSDAERARDRLAREIDVLVGDREMRDGAEHSRQHRRA